MSAEGELHLSDEEALCVADGQPVAPARLFHCERCEACAARVADLALASLGVHHDLRALAEVEPAAVAPARVTPSPGLPLALGLAVAMLASIPIVPSAARTFMALFGARQAHLDALGDLLRALWSSSYDPALSVATTALLVLLAAGLALFASRGERGGAADPEVRS